MNTALRRQREHSYRPTAQDLALGPYILMFHLLLLYWTRLKSEEQTTYRTMLVSRKDCDKYQKNTQFVWLSFVSSSVKPEKAEPFPTCDSQGDHKMLFVIDNTASSIWRPRNIERLAQFQEYERVYPSGAEYIITDRYETDAKTTILMKLLGKEYQ